ncbi:MAG: hypothetical protein EZS28_023465 [Streblomastix strix]|uniref:Condensation domain-containing protein n=1 Tax=Streblomastix strix TaxID=222440 RepID=A0A5J4VEI1_9EUKA|nr:MAG: hypothetical protein EZS28_023465 [Streblomastix strix]
MTMKRTFFGVEKYLIDIQMICSTHAILESPIAIEEIHNRLFQSIPRVWIEGEYIVHCASDQKEGNNHEPYYEIRNSRDLDVAPWVERETTFSSIDPLKSCIRVCVIKDGQSNYANELFVAVHHALFDGRSCLRLCQQLIGDIVVDSQKWTFPNPMLLSFPPNSDIMYPIDCLQFTEPSLKIPIGEGDAFKTRLHLLQLTVNETDQAKKLSKERNISMNSHILAALAQTIKDINLSSSSLSQSNYCIRLMTPVDMRRYGKFNEEIGNIVGDIRWVLNKEDLENKGKLGEIIHQRITERIERNQSFWILQALSQDGKYFPYKDSIAGLQNMDISGGITNLGVTGVSGSKAKDLIFFDDYKKHSYPFNGTLGAQVLTHNGRLILSVNLGGNVESSVVQKILSTLKINLLQSV